MKPVLLDRLDHGINPPTSSSLSSSSSSQCSRCRSLGCGASNHYHHHHHGAGMAAVRGTDHNNSSPRTRQRCVQNNNNNNNNNSNNLTNYYYYYYYNLRTVVWVSGFQCILIAILLLHLLHSYESLCGGYREDLDGVWLLRSATPDPLQQQTDKLSLFSSTFSSSEGGIANTTTIPGNSNVTTTTTTRSTTTTSTLALPKAASATTALTATASTPDDRIAAQQHYEEQEELPSTTEIDTMIENELPSPLTIANDRADAAFSERSEPVERQQWQEKAEGQEPEWSDLQDFLRLYGPNRANQPTTIDEAPVLGNKSANDKDHASANGTKRTKPLLVLHVGPPKTATTALQSDLYKLQHVLLQDNYYCGGRFYNIPSGTEGIKPRLIYYRESTPLLESAFNMMNTVVDENNPNANLCWPHRTKCIRDFRIALEPHRRAGQSVFLSEEAFAWMWESDASYQAIHDALHRDWDLLIVVAYRHFFDWVQSRIFQKYRLDGPNEQIKRWPHLDPEPRPLYRNVYLDQKLLFPHNLDKMLSWHETITVPWRILRRIHNANIPVKILNIHQTNAQIGSSIRSNFFCNILPNAPQTCQECREMDQQEHLDDQLRKEQQTAAMVTARVETAAMEREHQSNTTTKLSIGAANNSITSFTLTSAPRGGHNIKLNSQDTTIHFFYDIIVTAAAARGLIDAMQYSRKYMRERLHYFHQSMLNRSHTDFDLACPNQSQLQRLLDVSLLFQERAFRYDNSTTQYDFVPMQAELRIAFQNRVDRNLFCWVDTDAVLARKGWQAFFAAFAPRTNHSHIAQDQNDNDTV